MLGYNPRNAMGRGDSKTELYSGEHQLSRDSRPKKRTALMVGQDEDRRK
jgi:hypothetical protein